VLKPLDEAVNTDNENWARMLAVVKQDIILSSFRVCVRQLNE